MQAEMEEAPVALLNVPAPQGVGFVEESGQNEPIGQMTGAPDEQKWPAGQGTHVSWRMRLLFVSAKVMTPEGDRVRNSG